MDYTIKYFKYLLLGSLGVFLVLLGLSINKNSINGPVHEPMSKEVYLKKVVYADGYKTAYTDSRPSLNGCINTSRGEICGTYFIRNNRYYIPGIMVKYYSNIRHWENTHRITKEAYWNMSLYEYYIGE